MANAMHVHGLSRGRLREAPGAARGGRPPASPILRLQRSAGNHAVAGLLRGTSGRTAMSPIQCLTIGRPGDVYEQEADRIAAQVVAHLDRPNAPLAGAQARSQAGSVGDPVIQRQDIPEEELMLRSDRAVPAIQRQEGLGEEEWVSARGSSAMPTIRRQESLGEEEWVSARGLSPVPGIQRQEDDELLLPRRGDPLPAVQRQTEEEEEEELLQPSRSTPDGPTGVTGDAGGDAGSLQTRLSAARGGGQALDPAARTAFEGAFGHDFSGVRLHTNTDADDLADRLRAEAFTTGDDIYFRAGRYSLASDAGRFLLAHELTHVVQQGE